MAKVRHYLSSLAKRGWLELMVQSKCFESDSTSLVSHSDLMVDSLSAPRAEFDHIPKTAISKLSRTTLTREGLWSETMGEYLSANHIWVRILHLRFRSFQIQEKGRSFT